MDKHKNMASSFSDPCPPQPVPSTSNSNAKPLLELDKPRINSSRYEAYAIQQAIKKLGNIRGEVEAEVTEAIANARERPERAFVYPNYIGAGTGTSSVGIGVPARDRKSGKGKCAVKPTAVMETQQLVPRVYGPATKKLNVHPNERIYNYNDLLQLNVPPTSVKLKRAPQCEKKVDPMPCLEDYIKPQYCSIKPVRDYMATWAKCKIPEPSKEDIPVCPNPYQDDSEYYCRDLEPEFGIG